MNRLATAILLALLTLIAGAWPGLAQSFAQDPGGAEADRDKLEQRWQRMTPEEKQEMRERFQRWQNLPPEQKEEIKRKLDTWRKLPPEQKEQIRRNFERWRQLPPEQRERLRERWQQWRDLPPEQREALKRRFERFFGTFRLRNARSCGKKPASGSRGYRRKKKMPCANGEKNGGSDRKRRANADRSVFAVPSKSALVGWVKEPGDEPTGFENDGFRSTQPILRHMRAHEPCVFAAPSHSALVGWVEEFSDETRRFTRAYRLMVSFSLNPSCAVLPC
jgi:hypothetical protein